MLLGDPGCSLTQKETFHTTELVNPHLLQCQKTQVAKQHFVWTGNLSGNLLLRYAEIFMNSRTLSICNDRFQMPWKYDKSNLPPPALKYPSVSYVTLQCINALSVALPGLQKLCLDNGRWPLWLQGLCCIRKETSAMATRCHKSFQDFLPLLSFCFKVVKGSRKISGQWGEVNGIETNI